MLLLALGIPVAIFMIATHISNGIFLKGRYWNERGPLLIGVVVGGAVVGFILSLLCMAAWFGTDPVTYNVVSVSRNVNEVNYEEYVIDTEGNSGLFHIYRNELRIVPGREQTLTVEYESECPWALCVFDINDPYYSTPTYTLTQPAEG